MAIRLKNKQNTSAENSEYPYGNIRDDDGSGNGTPVNMIVHQDYIQFFHRMMAKAIENAKDGFDYNDVEDNAYDGFQLYEALLRTKPYKVYSGIISQTSTNDPVVVVHENTIGSIVWTRASAGVYRATLTNAFPVTNQVWKVISGLQSGNTASITSLDQDRMTVTSYDTTGSPADDLLSLVGFEIRVYP